MEEKLVKFEEKIKEIWKENKNIFLFTIFVTLIAHFQLYASMITASDAFIHTVYHNAIGETTLGRFGLYYVQAIKGNIVSPALATLLSSIFLGLTVVFVIKLLNIQNKYFKMLIAIIMAVSPNVSSTLPFFYCSDAYILGMLFATLAVYVIRKFEKSKIISTIASGILIAFAMSMYQSYLAVTMVLCVATLAIDILENKDLKTVGKWILKYIIMGVLGVIIYWCLLHLILNINNMQLSDYSGANEIGLQSLLELPEQLPQTYNDFIQFFFRNGMLPNSIWKTNYVYVAIFLISFAAITYLIIKNKSYKNKLNMLLLLILGIISPICFGVIELIAPKANVHILIGCAYILVFPIFFKIMEMLPQNLIKKLISYAMAICTIIIAWNYTWQDNAAYLSIRTQEQQMESVMLRIVTQIEELEEYNPDMPILFTGDITKNSYFNKYHTSLEAVNLYSRSWQFISGYPTLWAEHLDSYNKCFYERMGINVVLTTRAQNENILNSEEYKGMKTYPQKESIKIINNTVVVKLSE